LRKRIPVACVALATTAFIPVALSQAESAAPKPRVVKVRDNFFTPDSLTVPKSTKIVWRWPSSPGDVHDVRLTRRPDGVKAFNSKLSASDYTFTRKLTKAGKYTMVCTIHAEMKMTVKVRQ
jgi:plastocyanin